MEILLILEYVKNIGLILFSIVTVMGVIVSYIRIFNNKKTIKKINIKLESLYFKNSEREYDSVVNGSIFHEVNNEIYAGVMIDEKYEVEKLKREKQNLLEEISIYKIFKN